MGMTVTCFNRKEIYRFKIDNKNINFPTLFCPGSISENAGAVEHRKVSFQENV